MFAKKMKLKKIILPSILIVIIFITINLSMNKRDLSGDFTSTEIRQVQIGMNLQEVQDILKSPYQITSLAGLHDLNCKVQKSRLVKDIDSKSDIKQIVNQKFSDTNYCCAGNKQDLENKRVTLVYTNRLKFSRHYPMLWIHLDNNFQVESVFAKQYDGYIGLDDPCIYSLTSESHFEKTKLFNENFK